MVLTKSIKLSEETYDLLTQICPENKSYDDIIHDVLLETYFEYEELTDEEAEYCNKMIDKFEAGDYSDLITIKTSELDETLDKLEKQGKI